MEAKEQRLGEAVAYVPPGEGARSLWVFGELVMYKTRGEQTGGAYSLFEIASPPGGGPPPHIQHREDESFYLLEGEYEFLVEGRSFRVDAGSLIYVPRGTLHAHKNVGEETGRLLLSQTPGGLHERFFEEIGEPAEDNSRPPAQADQQHLEKIIAIATEYGIEIPPPDRPYGEQEEIPV
ncbi:MAG TPA: cupin domain-containing protein [Thermoanaerobaculia bacterium]|nr:cupin domain-containing protein [Thermoanaerobaculia bacterium]